MPTKNILQRLKNVAEGTKEDRKPKIVLTRAKKHNQNENKGGKKAPGGKKGKERKSDWRICLFNEY